MLLEQLTAEIDTRFSVWAFRGSLVDWHYFGGQVLIKDFDIVTADPFEPFDVSPVYGPRMWWRFMGRTIDVFAEPDPGPRMQTIEGRVARLHWLIEHVPANADKYRQTLERYARLQSPGPPTAPPHTPTKTCPHRGPQLLTIICDQCGQGKGQPKPVHSCAVHGQCTHRLERRDQTSQDPPIHVCIGCPDGPWSDR